MTFLRYRQGPALGSDVLESPLEELATRGFALVNQPHDLCVVEIEDIVQQQYRALPAKCSSFGTTLPSRDRANVLRTSRHRSNQGFFDEGFTRWLGF